MVKAIKDVYLRHFLITVIMLEVIEFDYGLLISDNWHSLIIIMPIH